MEAKLFGARAGGCEAQDCAAGYSMSSIVKLSVLSVLLSGVIAWGEDAKAVTDTFVASGTWTAPPGVTSVVVEAWGGGGAGGGNNTNVDGGGGGGGGGYSMATIAVVPGTVYTVTVGAGGTAVDLADGGAGGDSWFSTTATLLAKGGGGGAAPVGGAGGVGGVGGAAAAGVGTTRFSGGSGGTGRNSTTGRGGPGGSSAGMAANGTSGPTTWAIATAAAAPAGGGIGGNGGNANRQDGFVPASGNGGGGGGGAEQSTMGGAGASGKVVLTYTLPAVISINLADANPTGAASVSWTVTFNTSVDGVSSGNFALVNSGLGGAPAITSVTGGGTIWTITASTGTGAGTLGLDMVNDTGTSTVLSNLPFAGQVYTVDKTVPSVASMMRVDPTPTALASVSWTVVFSESVTGVDATDFALAQTGVSGALITAVTPVSGTTYTVTVSTGTGNGSLGLNLADDDSIIDAAGNPLGGAGAGNGDFSGETYSVVKTVSATASPTACINVTGIGTQAWGTLTGPLTSNNAYATASVNDNQTTNYLQCTGYGFAIPSTALIEGIVVNVERNASGSLIRDAAMRLVKDVSGVATIQATDRSTATNYTTTDVVEAHGGTADVWGDTWTAADINSANFGAAFASMKNGTFGGARTVRVDHMPTTVHYTVPVPVAEYRMDEAIWNGTANEVADGSGNGLHGSALLGATPATAKICNGANLAANYVQVPDNALLDITGALTITAWIKPARWGGAPADALMTFLSKDANFEGHVNATGNIVWWWGSGSITSTATAPVGVWTHVAMVYANGSQTLYINGAASGTSAVAGALPTNALPFQIGNDQEFGGGTRRFDGMIDEVKIFNRALPPARISAAYANENAGNNWDGTVRTCPTYGPHHIQISHDGNGLTCSPDVVTIAACANADCSALHTSGVAVTLTPGGQTFTIDATGINNAATVQQSTAGTTALAATSMAANAATCLNTATSAASCDITFSDSGFVVTVPNHTSCSNTTATIEAVQTAPGTGRCVPAYKSVMRAVNLKCAYANPVTGTLPVSAAGVALNSANDAAAACDSTGQSPSLSFDATGTASISLIYPDAGQLTLTANDTAPTGKAMAGSATFVVAPAAFAFSAIPAAPLTAGQAFNTTVTAMNACATPAATPNFSGTVTLTSSNPQPGAGNATAINTTLSGFSSGVASTNLVWGEVGTIDLNASLNAYLGWTPVAPAAWLVRSTQTSVGRFHPAYFDTAVTPACATFTYAGSNAPAKAGQPFAVTVTAKETGGGTTVNYAGAAHAYDTTLSNAGDTFGFAGNTIVAADFANGVGSANVTYAVAIPETPVLTLALRATDGDPVPVSSSGHIEATAEIRSGRAKLGNAHGSELLNLSVPFRAEYYWNGGWMFNSADTCSGDEAQGGAVSISLSASPVTCVLDNGSPGLSNAGCAAAGPAGRRFKDGSGGGFSGDFSLWLKAPGAGATGAVTVTGNVPDWLHYAWDGGAAVDPAGRATFGVYKGNEEFIYLREAY